MQLFVFQEKRDVVDTGRRVVHVGNVLVKAFGKMGGGVLHAVAKADRAEFRGKFLDRPSN